MPPTPTHSIHNFNGSCVSEISKGAAVFACAPVAVGTGVPRPEDVGVVAANVLLPLAIVVGGGAEAVEASSTPTEPQRLWANA